MWSSTIRGLTDYSPAVMSTNWQGAFDATEYLLDLGHTRIGHIAGDQRLSAGIDRLSGYRAALEKHHIAYDPTLVIEGFFNDEASGRAAHALLDRADRPTAIFAASDAGAFTVLDAIRVRGLRVPEDISLIGFDDIPEAAYVHPALTTIRQPLYDMGRIATRMLLQIIATGTLLSKRTVVQTELVERQSCRSCGAVHFRRAHERRPAGAGVCLRSPQSGRLAGGAAGFRRLESRIVALGQQGGCIHLRIEAVADGHVDDVLASAGSVKVTSGRGHNRDRPGRCPSRRSHTSGIPHPTNRPQPSPAGR